MKTTHYTPAEHTSLPTEPGIYKFHNQQDTIIYIGKAKNIRKRVSNYFNNTKTLHIKTHRMITNIHTITCTIVNNEHDALILENNLIKQHQPRYNILLKDGKTYPYLCITQEPFPQLLTTRKKTPSLGQYYGPFISTKHLEKIEKLIRYLYPIRRCHYKLTPNTINANKYKVCLEYHIGNCLGPCTKLQTQEAYNKMIQQVTHILKGNFQTIKQLLKQEMLTAAKTHQYQKAQQYKEKIQAIQDYQAHSILAQPRLGTLDILVTLTHNPHTFVSYFHIKKGIATFTQTLTLQKKLEETDEDIPSIALLHFRQKTDSTAKTILTNTPITTPPNNTKVIIPKTGDKYKLIQLALKNAYLAQKEHQNKTTKQQNNNILQLLQKDLNLKKPPQHIECFDNSNLQGTNPVAGMVCYKNGKPSKKDYRHFHIKTVIGPDDFASMREIIQRRYQHLITENKPLPNLIIIDGGKGQLSAAYTTLQNLALHEKIEIIAIAKKQEFIYTPNNPAPIIISKKSPSLKLLQHIRNNTHDFAIQFHRKTRKKNTLKSQLQTIPTFGPKTIQKLLTTFHSIQNIKQTPTENLINTIGQKKTQLLLTHLHNTPKTP